MCFFLKCGKDSIVVFLVIMWFNEEKQGSSYGKNRYIKNNWRLYRHVFYINNNDYLNIFYPIFSRFYRDKGIGAGNL